MSTLGDLTVAKIDQSGPPKAGEFTYIDISSIDNKLKRIVDSKCLPVTAAPGRAKQRLQPGDVLVSMTRPNLNAVAIVSPDLKGAIGSTGFHVLRAVDGIESRWLLYAVQTHDFVETMSSLVQGALYPAVRPKDIRAFSIEAPPFDEQQQIVAEIEKQFSCLDEAIATLKRVKANLNRYKAAVLKAAVEGELTEEWRKEHPDVEPASKLLEHILAERRAKWIGKGKYKEPSTPDTGTLPTLPEKWTWTNVDQLAEVGTGATPRRGKSQYYTGGHISWVTSSALNREYVDKADEFVTDTALQETNLTLYPPGTLLLAMYGEGRTRGKCSELRIDATTNQAIAAIQCAGKVRDYLKLAIWNQYEDLRRTASGGVQPNLNLSLVRSITIPFPPLIEQQRIVAEVERRLSVIEELQAVVEADLTRADRLRQAILNSAFSGKLVAMGKTPAHSSVSAVVS